MAETPQPVDAGQVPTPTTGQDVGSASSPPPQPGYGWSGPWSPPAYPGWSGYWPPPAVQRGPLLKPGFAPGPIFIGLTAAIMCLGVILSSDPNNGPSWLAVGVGLNIGFVWLVAFIIGSQDTRLIISRRAWTRWALPPAIFFVAVSLIVSGIPTTARFEMSRSALDQAAASAQSGNHVGSGWIGLIDVEDVRVVDGGTFFYVSVPESGQGCAFAKLGAADAQALNSWLGDSYGARDYGGGWWYGCTGYPSD